MWTVLLVAALASAADAVPATARVQVDLYGNMIASELVYGQPVELSLVTGSLLGLPGDRGVPLPAGPIGTHLLNPWSAGVNQVERLVDGAMAFVVSDRQVYVSGAATRVEGATARDGRLQVNPLDRVACARLDALDDAYTRAHTEDLYACTVPEGAFSLVVDGLGDTREALLFSTATADPLVWVSRLAEAPGPLDVKVTTRVGAEPQAQETLSFASQPGGENLIKFRPRGSQVSFHVGASVRGGTSWESETRPLLLGLEADAPFVNLAYGIVCHDLGRSVSGTVMVMPNLAPRALADWPRSYGRNFFGVAGGLRFGSNEDILGLALGPAFNLAPGFSVLGGLQLGTSNITEPWVIDRNWYVGLGFSPTLFESLRKLDAQRRGTEE